jgi:hypothetical protein
MSNSVLSRIALGYLAVAEVAFVWYELTIRTAPSADNMNGLVLGLVLTAITLPSVLLGFVATAAVHNVLPLVTDTSFIGHIVMYQIGILLNFVFIARLTRSRRISPRDANSQSVVD